MLELARAAFERAQSRAGVTIVPLDTLAGQRAGADLWTRVWGRDAEPPASAELLRALAHAGNYMAGAYRGSALVGALLGFYGGDTAPDHLHSHMLGVDTAQRTGGVGFALKLHQRLWSMERGLDRIEWTYDPLVRGNGFFNLAKLRAQGIAYAIDFYGSMTDAINAGGESDRVVISWDLRDPRVMVAAGDIPQSDQATEPLEIGPGLRGARIALDIGAEDAPVSGTGDGDLLLCRVPADIVGLRRRDPEMARAWRSQLRLAMVEAMGRGLRLQTMTRDGWYVLGHRTVD